jgi:hypothetical protein
MSAMYTIPTDWESNKTILNNYLFIVDLQKIKCEDGVSKDDFSKNNFIIDQNLKYYQVFIPIDDKKCLEGMCVIYFSNGSDMQIFKNVKIKEKSVKIFDKNF